MLGPVHVRQALARLGGVADRATLVALTSRPEVDGALRSGDIVTVARGCYALPVADEALRAAGALRGTVSHLSAALLWGWEVATVPRLPEVTVPRHRRPGARAVAARLHWADLPEADRVGRVTSPTRTLVDCLRRGPFHEALAVADSAVRNGPLDGQEVAALADTVRGPGGAGARRVARHVSGLAANPFESGLRATSLEVPGLRLVPQVEIRTPGFSARPDLVDEDRRIVAEADSFAWHGQRRALRDDARRYNHLVVRGWRVLRFSWEDVMHDPAYVRAILGAAVR